MLLSAGTFTNESLCNDIASFLSYYFYQECKFLNGIVDFEIEETH